MEEGRPRTVPDILASAGEFFANATRPRTAGPGLYLEPARQRAFKSMLLISFVAGLTALAPMAVGATRALSNRLVPAYMAAYAIVAVVFAFRNLSPRIHYLTAVATLLALGSTVFAVAGPAGGGLVWLAATPLFAAALLGPAAGFLAYLASAGAAALLGLLAFHGRLPWAPPGGMSTWYFASAVTDLLLLVTLGLVSMSAGRAERDAKSDLKGMEALERELSASRNELHEERETHLLTKRAARKQESLFRALVEHSADAVLILDADGRIRLCGSSVRSTLGYDADELRGRDFFSLLTEEYAADRRAMFASSLVAGLPTFSTLFSVCRKDGSELPVEASASNYIHNPDIVGLVLSLHDLTREKKAEAKAEFFEHFDPLTSLPNKDSFLHEVERAVTIARNRSRVFGVMALGLDRFKRINDMYGTGAGDGVLREVAAALRSSFRNDDIVSRYRGDMFFILFPEIRSQEHIKEVIAKARTAFERPFALPVGERTVLSSSMGVALYPNDGNDAPELVRNAETALYMAKESGRDRYRLFDATLNGQLLERQRIEGDLAISIEENRFEPYFQPKVDARGFIVGAEALIRWRHPGGEIKSPGFFIDVAEKSGAIDRIGGLILRCTCEMATSWHAQGLPQLPISVNLSTRQFGRDDLLDEIRSALAGTGMDPRLIEFEITESGIMENEREGIRKLLMLKELGTAVSIDDFGTGYSSFSKLKDYPIDTVKIDKSFVDPLPDDRKAMIIASAIVDLAHTLSFTVVAEGVEHERQLQFLNTIFCDTFQGYLFSKPVPEREFKAMLASGKSLAARTAAT